MSSAFSTLVAAKNENRRAPPLVSIAAKKFQNPIWFSPISHEEALYKIILFRLAWCLGAKCAKRTNPNNHIHGGPFHNSHGSSWFRGARLASVFLANINGDFFMDPLCWCQNSHQWWICIPRVSLVEFLQYEQILQLYGVCLIHSDA